MVGLGPGRPELITLQARQALEEAEVFVGYCRYLELIREFIGDRETVASGMRQEIERCRQAVEMAASGRKVALVSSGDPGIYGMAGVVLEILGGQEEWQTRPEVEVIPGITAASAAAARLGAPLMNDFAVVSLSDLLTPWEVIVNRVRRALEGDFVLALYNPASHRRRVQVPEIGRIALEYRPPHTPVGLVDRAYRTGERVRVVALADLPAQEAGMETLVIIGNSQTVQCGDYLVTRRGYRW